jgi:S-formylglutathione hydrolase FrmB
VPGPNSWLFLTVLAVAFAGLLTWLARDRRVPLQVVAGVLSFGVCTLFGASLVNHYYDYYTTWGALYDDLTNNGATNYAALSGIAPVASLPGQPTPASSAHHHHPFGLSHVSSPPPSPTPATMPAVAAHVPTTVFIPRLALSDAPDHGTGRVVQLKLPGASSGITRSAYVYLPPQYFEPAYANTAFPVLELLHGDPGTPNNWIYALGLPAVMDTAIQTGQIGPLIVVMPATFTGPHGNDCVDGSTGPQNDTYLSHDVPADIVQDFRALPPGPHWGIGGLSDGGYCAANLALRHRNSYGAVAAMDGFLTVDSDLAVLGQDFGNNAGALAADDPTVEVADPNQSLPKFWLLAGTGNSVDLDSAASFRSVLLTREPVRYVVVEGGQHTPPSWRVGLPNLLAWSWLALTGQPAPSGTAYLHLNNHTAPTGSTSPRPPTSPAPASSDVTSKPPASPSATRDQPKPSPTPRPSPTAHTAGT